MFASLRKLQTPIHNRIDRWYTYIQIFLLLVELFRLLLIDSDLRLVLSNWYFPSYEHALNFERIELHAIIDCLHQTSMNALYVYGTSYAIRSIHRKNLPYISPVKCIRVQVRWYSTTPFMLYIHIYFVFLINWKIWMRDLPLAHELKNHRNENKISQISRNKKQKKKHTYNEKRTMLLCIVHCASNSDH